MNNLEWEVLLATRNKLLEVPHGGKAGVLATACVQLQCSEQTLYRKLATAGLETDRKARKDKGDTVYTHDQLGLISGMLVSSTRANEKRLLTIEDVVELLHADGKLPCVMSASWVAQLLRSNTLHPDQLNHATPAQSLRSLHPNHCWQIDASVCVLYYMKGGTLKAMNPDEFYRNKPQNVAKIVNDMCTRYACTDHYSGTIWSRYYLGGETAENLLDFMMFCITQREGVPAHGAPWMLMLDPGAANKSFVVKNFCERMKIKLNINEAGNPRSKGQVENANNLIERHFEGLLRFMPTLDLVMLNQLNQQWQISYNASRKHTRHGQPRYSLWMQISAEQLRIAPPLVLMRDLATSKEETRRVDNTMQVSFAAKGYGSRSYDVRYVPGVLVGQTVTVVVNAYRAPAIDVRFTDAETGELRWMCVEPIVTDAAGFNINAAVIGEEYKAPPNTVADGLRNDIAKQAYGVASIEEADKARKLNKQAYVGINAMAAIEATQLPAYLPRQGTALETEKRAMATRHMTVPAAAKRIMALAGTHYTPQTYGWLQAKFGATGVPEDQIVAIAERLGLVVDQAEATGTDVPQGLRVVGGAR
jgi:hypothetical protein